jgi:hypothetical protein
MPETPPKAGESSSSTQESIDTAPETTNGTAPEPILDRLRAAYATAGEERRETFPVLPGRFNGSLAVECHPVDWKAVRKRVKRLMKRGQLGSEEGDLEYAAQYLVDACEQFLVRPGDGEDFKPLHEAVPRFGPSPVRYDARLAEAIGLSLTGNESPAQIVRVLFLNPAALNDHFVAVDQWNKEATPSDEDDDEDEGRERPT